MRNCIVCNSNKKTNLFDSSVIVPSPYPLRGDQKIEMCEQCGFVFSDSENTIENYHEYYKTLNKHKKRATDAKDLDIGYYKKIYNLLNLPGKDFYILDFGAGDLLMKDILLAKGFKHIFTFDVDSDMPDDKQYDLIISTHTFEHILDADVVLRKLASCLKPGGQIFLAVPDVEGYVDNYCGPYNWFDLEHINHFSSLSLTNLVQNSGLSVISRIRDRREVRPGLYYPEVIIRGTKDNIKSTRITGDFENKAPNTALQNYLRKSERDFRQLLHRFTKIDSSRLIIWGLSISVMRLVYHLPNINVDFVDSNPNLWDKTFMGKTILAPDELADINLEETAWVIAAINFQDIVKTVQKRFAGKAKIINLSITETDGLL
ncbi:MAG: class I SAM-dependent methyltransferase [Planctomycetes bacterium]|nr:class I SAM-dependent methyltransferase [Planctomycetota bacterium]